MEEVKAEVHNGDQKLDPTSQKPPIKKSRRHSVRKPRTKGLVKKLQIQMEFYFGDANLPKDKFLQQEMKKNEDGYVAVDIVASFKKMQSLTSDKSLILEAIRNSTMLELSEDSLGMRRCIPLPDLPQSTIDSRTIYIEKLPSTASIDHESLSKMFKVFGDVTYISLPRHKSTGDLKGFAFIEFSSQDAADKAVEYFKPKEALSTTNSEKQDTASTDDVVASDGHKGDGIEVDESKATKEAESENSDDMKKEEDGSGKQEVDADSEGEIDSSRNRRKRKREEDDETEEESETQSMKDKKKRKEEASEGSEVENKKLEPSQEGEDDNTEEAVDSSKNRKRTREAEDEPENAKGDLGTPVIKRAKVEKTVSKGNTTESGSVLEEGALTEEKGGETTEEEGAGVSTGKSKRKRSRQHKKKQSLSALKELNLRVMSKNEWIGLKKVFKDLQKSHMKKVKSETHRSGQGKSQGRGFVKECLVKVELENSWSDSDKPKLKDFCGQFGEVAFVDMHEGESTGYVRFAVSGCVGDLIASTEQPSGMSFAAVREEDERAYYLKAQAERKQHFVKGKKKMKQRGQEKLVSKALKKSTDHVPKQPAIEIATSGAQPTHIKFSDSEQSDNE